MQRVSPHSGAEIENHNKEKSVIIFEATGSLKGQKSAITSFRHLIRPDASRVKPIREWVADGKMAVMFSIEGKSEQATAGIGYVFIDKYCYLVEYKSSGKFWLLIRAEPNMSTCYYGTRQAWADRLTPRIIRITDQNRSYAQMLLRKANT